MELGKNVLRKVFVKELLRFLQVESFKFGSIEWLVSNISNIFKYRWILVHSNLSMRRVLTFSIRNFASRCSIFFSKKFSGSFVKKIKKSINISLSFSINSKSNTKLNTP